MSQPALVTSFASPDRLNHEKLTWLHGLLRKDHGLCHLIDAMPELVMVLGESRQILLANRAVRDFAATQGIPGFLGMRPGEFLSCQEAAIAPSGCGTGDACSSCGAVESILAALAGDQACHECRVLRTTTEGIAPLDLKVWATPLRWHGMSLVLLVAVDICDEKRRKAMELIFFPDILHNDGAISSLSEFLFKGLMTQDNAEEPLRETAQALVAEIRTQRELLAAENNEVTVTPAPVQSLPFLESLARTFRDTPQGSELSIDCAPQSDDAIFHTDERLLGRVLGHLVRNALDASVKGGSVTIGCTVQGSEISFWCHNAGVIPDENQQRIFRRSFSSTGHGIGSYLVKLLTERYLKGRVAFVSSPAEGTTFTVTCPLDLRG